MSMTDSLLANNGAYAAYFDKGGLPLPPAKKVGVIDRLHGRPAQRLWRGRAARG